MDCFARVYDVYTGECVVARKFAKQVTAIALSARGGELGIGCFGGALEWWRLVDAAPDATPKFAWAHKGDINGIAVSAFDTELAVATDKLVVLYALATGTVLYNFVVQTPARAVSLAQNLRRTIRLSDGTELHGVCNISDHVESVEAVASAVLESVGESKLVARGDAADGGGGAANKWKMAANKAARASRRERPSLARRSSFSSAHGTAKEGEEGARVVLPGVIHAVCDRHGVVNVWTALYDSLEGVQWTVMMLALVAAGSVVSLIQGAEDIKGGWMEAFSNVLAIVFAVEVGVRLYCHHRVNGGFAKFFGSPYCVLDLLVVVLEGLLFLLSGLAKSVDFIPVKSLRLARFLRLARLLKASRLVELAAGKEVEEYFDVQLPNGHMFRRVPGARARARRRALSGRKLSPPRACARALSLSLS